MTEIHAPLLRGRPHKSASRLYVSLTIAGAISLAGLVAQVVAAMAYNPINILSHSCPDDAWRGVATAITLFTLTPAGIFLLVALTQSPLIWAGGQSEWIGRALATGVLASLAGAVIAGVVKVWLEALASAGCVEEPGGDWFMWTLSQLTNGRA